MRSVEHRVRGVVVVVATVVAMVAVKCRGGPHASSTDDALESSASGPSMPGTALPLEPSGAELAKSFGLEIAPSLALDSDGVAVHVVDEVTRTPVADALVVSVDEREFCQLAWGIQPDDPDLGHELKRLATATLTDATGAARVARHGLVTGVYAIRGARFGRTCVQQFDRADHAIALSNRDLRVEVVDGNGRPQPNVPIALGGCVIEKSELNSWWGATGADGAATIPAIELVRRVHFTCGRHAVVAFGFPARALAARQIDAARLEPVKLVLPKCGALEVEVDDASGRQLHGESWLRVTAYDRDQLLGSIPFQVKDGRLVLDRVEVGLRLTIGAGAEGFDFDGVGIDGPSTEGERKLVVVRARSDDEEGGGDGASLVVTGTVVDEHGEPRREVALERWFDSQSLPPGPATVVTDVDGRLEFPTTRAALRFGGRLRLVETEPITPPRESASEHGVPRSFGSVDVSRDENSSRVDVGVVTLKPVPLLVSGRVVDQTGAPVAERRIRIGERDEGKPHRSTSIDARGHVWHPYSTELEFDDVTTDATGAFEVRDLPPTDMKLELDAEDANRRAKYTESVPFEVGATGLTVVAPTASALEASLVLDDAGQRWRDEFFNPWWLSLGFRRQGFDSPSNGFDDEAGTFDSNGRLVDPWFEPGRYDVAVRVWTPGHGDTTLLEVDDVDVGPRQHVRDPRLVDVDVRGRLRPHLVEVMDAEGRPRDGELRFPERPADRNPVVVSIDHGRCNVVTLPDEPTRCTVRVPGCRTAEVERLSSYERVVVKRGIPVRLTLDPSWKWPRTHEGPPTAKVHLVVGVAESAGGSVATGHSVSDSVREVELEPGGSAHFELSEPGDWPVELQQSTRDGRSTYDEHTLALREPTIHVLDRDEEQLFVLSPLPPESDRAANDEQPESDR